MAQIQKGTTYITGDQVTAANLNALADSAILLAGAITDQTAKTVPLAADTLLIHSAADTALRKSTLTQVFANATGIPISTGISGLGSGVATFLGTPSSANLAAAVSDETGSGALVFATSPTLVTPALGAASATSIAASGTVTGSNLSGTNTGDQTITLTGGVTGSGTGSFAATVVTNANLTGAITSVGNATSLGSFTSANLASALTDETGSGAAVFATSPTLVTPNLGTPQSGTLTSCTGLPISTGVSGLGTGVATALAVNVGSAGAPVVNGGALGTPSSGTVTNLTGTASININGTVGATTPSTVAGTTGTFSSGFITNNANSATELSITNTNTGVLARTRLAFVTDLGTSAFISYRRAIGDFIIGSDLNIPVSIFSNAAAVGTFTSTGLAVTGALSSTGILSGPGFRASKTTASSGLVKIQDEGANVYNVIGSRNNADSAALPLNFQATNFAFNGAVDITGGLVVGVAGTGTGITIKEYSVGTQRNWGIRDDFGVDRLRFSRGASDQAFWDVLKVAASDQTGNQYWYTNGAQRMELSSTGLAVTGALSCTGALSKGSGSFRIEHPLPEKSATHQLVHSFIEGPQADLIYRGKVVLVDGKASVNIDAAATMTEGTFAVLCRDVQCFTTNETGWTAVRGKVTGNILTIEAKDADCVDEISWMVIGERQDPHIMDTDWTDENGRPIVEPLKPAEPALESN